MEQRPRFIDEVEAIAGEFFDEHTREHIRRKGLEGFEPGVVDIATSVYVGALRMLAQERLAERRFYSILDPDAEPMSDEELNNWNEDWVESLTMPRITSIKGAHDGQLQRVLHRQRELQHYLHHQDGATPPRITLSDVRKGLRPHQYPYMTSIYNFLHEPHQRVTTTLEGSESNEGAKTQSYMVHGAVVDAPTGSGKTVLAARTAMAAEIGANGRRLLIVVPSRALIRQFTGKFGDNTFQRFLSENVTVGGYDSQEKELDHDIVVTTIDQFVARTSDGTFCGQHFDMLMIDEAHMLTQPLFKKVFLEQWRRRGEDGADEPIPTIGFTATAAYDEEKDVRTILPATIKHADIISYMEEGVLNAGQFFFMDVEPRLSRIAESVLYEEDTKFTDQMERKIRHEAINMAAVEFFVPLLAQGRRGIIFVAAGNEAENARKLAKMFRQTKLPDGSHITAEALHSFKREGEPSSNEVLDRYASGETQVLVSVGMGDQGLNADFDFVGVNDVTSLLRLRQIMGRGTRRSAAYPTTVYAQFFARQPGRSVLYKTFYDALGVDTVEQGFYLGKGVVDGKMSRIRHDDLVEKGQILKTTDFPGPIRDLLEKSDQRVIGDLIVGATCREDIPADYVPFSEIYDLVKDKIDIRSAKYRLDARGYAWKGVVVAEKEKRKLVRYYESAALTFFEKNPLPPAVADGQLTLHAAAKKFGVSIAFMERLASRLRQTDPEFELLTRIGKNGRIARVLDVTAVERSREEIARIPRAEKTDQSIGPLGKKHGFNEEAAIRYATELGIKSVYKRRASGKGFTWFIDKAQADRLIQRFEKSPVASDDEWNLARIAEAAGITGQQLMSYLTDDDYGKSFSRRSVTKQGYMREMDHWSREEAQRLIEMARNRFTSLGAHLVPYTVVREYLNVSNRLPNSVPEELVEKVPLPGTRPVLCLAWDGLRRLAESHHLKEGRSLPDFSRLPTSPEDTDVERNIYARALQLTFLTARRMGNPDGIID